MAKRSLKWLALLGSALISMSSSLHAQDSGPLIQMLVKKGLINDQEAEDLRSELTKNFAETNAGKLNLSSSLTELRISGDVRIRYEYRNGENPAGDSTDRNRFRYRVRPALTGRLGSDWFFGIRIENSAKARSSNVTLGDDAGPFAKTNDTVYVGQVYVGYTPTNEITLLAGRMPNPLVSTLMVWDADINPEGLAEQYKKRSGQIEYGVNLGQFIYDSGNPQNVFGATGNKNDQYLFASQAVVKFYTGEGVTSFLQVAPTVYNYSGTTPASKQKNFAGSFTAATASAINDLFVFDIPVEYDLPIAGVPSRVFGDFAYNMDGSKRATRYGRPDLKGEDKAYQFGFQYGKAKLKGEWDAKVFYQATGLFALDANLVDSDIFDSRVNMEGVVFNTNYQISDAVTATFTWAHGNRKNTSDVTPGATGEPDLAGTTLTKYNLFQADLVLKF